MGDKKLRKKPKVEVNFNRIKLPNEFLNTISKTKLKPKRNEK